MDYTERRGNLAAFKETEYAIPRYVIARLNRTNCNDYFGRDRPLASLSFPSIIRPTDEA